MTLNGIIRRVGGRTQLVGVSSFKGIRQFCEDFSRPSAKFDAKVPGWNDGEPGGRSPGRTGERHHSTRDTDQNYT